MEYANEEILKIGCNKKENKKGIGFLKEHKIMSFIIACTIILIGINGFMLYEFISIFNTL